MKDDLQSSTVSRKRKRRKKRFMSLSSTVERMVSGTERTKVGRRRLKEIDNEHHHHHILRTRTMLSPQWRWCWSSDSKCRCSTLSHQRHYHHTQLRTVMTGLALLFTTYFGHLAVGQSTYAVSSSSSSSSSTSQHYMECKCVF